MSKFIDPFAGIGGFRVALEKQALDCVFSSEIDEEASLIYRRNFGGAVADFDEGIELIRDRLNTINRQAENLKNNWEDHAKETAFSLQCLYIN